MFCSLNDQGQINIFTFAQINKEQDNNDNFYLHFITESQTCIFGPNILHESVSSR